METGILVTWDVSNANGCREGDVVTLLSQYAPREVLGDE